MQILNQFVAHVSQIGYYLYLMVGNVSLSIDSDIYSG